MRDLRAAFPHSGAMISNDLIRVQGRVLSVSEFLELQELIDQHPDWSRHRVAKELCQRWNWRTPWGQLKTFAARSLLLKLEQRHQLRLPAVREECRRQPWGLGWAPVRDLAPVVPIQCELNLLRPLCWTVCLYGTAERERALYYLRQYHYLGCNRPVGTHLLYLVQDAPGRDVAVHLVGAAAWQCAPRDKYIGWSPSSRSANLPQVANHSRFLILPWVRVPHLASHLLGELTRRISKDWRQYHGWSLQLLETFVEVGRFAGVAYRAANWQAVGKTTGRTRQEKHHRVQAPAKSVWVYPLEREFRQRLGLGCQGGGAQ